MIFKALKPCRLNSDENPPPVRKDWKQQFDLYLTTLGKQDVDDEQKVAMLLCSMDTEYVKVFNSVTFANNDKRDLKELLNKGTHVNAFTICLNMKKGYCCLFLDPNLQ